MFSELIVTNERKMRQTGAPFLSAFIRTNAVLKEALKEIYSVHKTLLVYEGYILLTPLRNGEIT